MIEAVNTANLYSTRSFFLSLKANTDALDSTRSSSLSLKVNIDASDSTRSDILELTELPNASWTYITSLTLEMLIFT